MADRGIDGIHLTSPDGATATLVIEAKQELQPGEVARLATAAERHAVQCGATGALVVAPFLSSRTQTLLKDAGISYLDQAGNVRITLERPAMFLYTKGADESPFPELRPVHSLKGPAAGRVVRGLCDLKPPYGVEDFSKRTTTSLGTVSRYFTFLADEAFVTREPRGPVTSVDWPALLRRWAEDYQFLSSNTWRSYLDPRGLLSVKSKLATLRQKYAITGSMVAAEIAPFAPTRLATIYVEHIGAAAEQLGLRPVDSGSNVILAEPFNAVVFERTTLIDGLRAAALSQVAADLLTGPGRSSSEGEELLRWMEANEDVWRS
jgi:hypothetical protein